MTTEPRVRNVLPPDTALTCQQIEQAIEAASCLTEQLNGLDDKTMLQVETYLSAHYCAANEIGLAVSSETDGCVESSASYGFKLGQGILGSRFGQLANTLSKGQLKRLDTERPVGLFSIGSH